eukprot:COSAG05_NODE_13_length_36464_cov_294.169449_10_plen_98_part_00
MRRQVIANYSLYCHVASSELRSTERAISLNESPSTLDSHEDLTHTCINTIDCMRAHLTYKVRGKTKYRIDDRLRHHIYTSAIFYIFNISINILFCCH